jgi:hypothetical protein
MSTFLETLKARMADSETRLQEAQRKLNSAQREHDLAAKECASWQTAVEIETRKSAPAAPAQFTLQQPADEEDKDEGANKTEMIRDVLRKHPAGATPADVWKALQGQIKQRNYVYSVLKRLKDRNKVTTRRGKYFLVATQDEQEGIGILQ